MIEMSPERGQLFCYKVHKHMLIDDGAYQVSTIVIRRLKVFHTSDEEPEGVRFWQKEETDCGQSIEALNCYSNVLPNELFQIT